MLFFVVLFNILDKILLIQVKKMIQTETMKQTLQDFFGNPQYMFNQISNEKCDLILQENGEDKFVLISEERYQNILRSLNALESFQSIHKGIEDMEAGRVTSKEDFF